MKRFFKNVKVFVLLGSMTILYPACNNNTPFQPGDTREEASVTQGVEPGQMLEKLQTRVNRTDGPAYPQSASLAVKLLDRLSGFTGGKMEVPNGSSFAIRNGALTPPGLLNVAGIVLLKMDVEFDQEKNELVTTFGPCGSQFDPPAQAWFSYQDLGIESASVYYINANGEYELLQPVAVDRENKRIMVEIRHFSRYAIAQSK